jgi:hypothetical protein
MRSPIVPLVLVTSTLAAACESGPATDAPSPSAALETVAGCENATFYAVPSDPAERGPWPVGAREVTIDGLTTEIWYPAVLGSEAGEPKKIYDLRYALPASEQAKVTDADNAPQVCDCYDQLPIDDAHGPYPVVIFIHGLASWRAQSASLMTHWASRGFVVASSDHPGLKMADMLGLACGLPAVSQDLSGDTDRLLAALGDPSGDLAFLAGLIDTDRVAIAGHSAGGDIAASQAAKPSVRVSIAMGSTTPIAPGAMLESALFLGVLEDHLVPYAGTRTAYELSQPPKRLVGLRDAGHLAFSDVCQLENAEGQNIVEIAIEAGVCGAELAKVLVECDPADLDPAITGAIIDHATTAVLEQGLRCVEGADPFADFEATHPDVGEYREAL